MKTRGTLLLVSVGPGFADLIAPAAKSALERSEYIIAYELYLQWIKPWLIHQKIVTLPLTQERERAAQALALARAGAVVSLVSSGDIGVYAMASLAFDLMEESDEFDVQVIPGISAANSCASLLGSPLSHDFATLSLSDLLCPWDWIERRAQHLAQADMTMALYNVQSKIRQQGVYQILKICQEYKSPETWCGVVRKAYREEQDVKICTLAELAEQKFDMLTTLIIGNRFTQCKRQFLYTPRGYLGWEKSVSVQPKIDLPDQALWIFSGTSDGNTLARSLTQRGHRVIISTSSDYGRELAQAEVPNAHFISGRLGLEKRKELLQQHRAQAIVDATHPYALKISNQLQNLAQELNLPYLRFERAPSPRDTYATYCSNAEDAAREALRHGKRIFLATGVKDISTFLPIDPTNRAAWFVRITPEQDSLQRVLAAGIPRDRICAMQGPASQQLNIALWSEWQIDCVVTKESGEAGGFSEKLKAARKLGIPLVVIERPTPVSTQAYVTVSDIVHKLEKFLPSSTQNTL